MTSKEDLKRIYGPSYMNQEHRGMGHQQAPDMGHQQAPDMGHQTSPLQRLQEKKEENVQVKQLQRKLMEARRDTEVARRRLREVEAENSRLRAAKKR
jgi:hypothetical protein